MLQGKLFTRLCGLNLDSSGVSIAAFVANSHLLQLLFLWPPEVT